MLVCRKANYVILTISFNSQFTLALRCFKGVGHYMAMIYSPYRPGFTARFTTDYINTTHTCLELYYIIVSGNKLSKLSVKTISEELNVTFVGSTLTAFNDWKRLFVALPNGVNRISIEGYRDVGDTTGCQISVDDIIIQDCSLFGKCILIL